MERDDGDRRDPKDGARKEASIAPTPQVSCISSTLLMDQSKRGRWRGGALHFG